MFRKILTEMLGRRPRPKQLRETATELRAEAERRERLAVAIEDEHRKPPAQRVRRRSPKAGPGRNPGTHVSITRAFGKTRIRVGRALWYALASPERFDLQVLDGTLALIPASGDVGWKVVSTNQAPLITCSSADDIVPPDGEYTAEIVGHTIRLRGRSSSETEQPGIHVAART